MINYTLTPVVRTYAITGHAVVLKPFFVVAATRTYAFTGVANLWHAGSTLRGITIVSPIKDVLQGVVLSRNVFRGVTVSIGSGTGVLQLRVADNQNRPIQGAVCRVLNAIGGSNNVPYGDGVDDYINVSTHLAPTGANSRTVEMWVKPDGTQNKGFFAYGTRNIRQLFTITTYNGKIGIHWYGNTISGEFTAMDYTAGNWHHVAFSYNGSQIKAYMNGVLKNTVTVALVTGTSALRMLADTTGGYSLGFLKGWVSDVRVWNVERTENQINDNKALRLKGNETGLVEYWKLDEGSGTTVSGINNNGTIFGATWAEVEDLPIFKGQFDTITPFDSQTTNANGLCALNYQINKIHGLEVTLPGKRRFIMPFERTARGLLDWQVMLSDYLATFLTDNGELLINANPQDNDNNFLLEA